MSLKEWFKKKELKRKFKTAKLANPGVSYKEWSSGKSQKKSRDEFSNLTRQLLKRKK